MKRIKSLQTNYFKRALFFVRVEGESMWPVLVSGKRYIASNVFGPRPGDIAVFRRPKETSRIFVKRVVGASGDCFMMESAVSWGSSSADFGPVRQELILGKLYGIKTSGN